MYCVIIRLLLAVLIGNSRLVIVLQPGRGGGGGSRLLRNKEGDCGGVKLICGEGKSDGYNCGNSNGE